MNSTKSRKNASLGQYKVVFDSVNAVDGWDWAILDAQGEEIERFTEEVDAVSVARDMAKAEAEAEAEERAEAEAEAADQAATEQAESDLDSLNDIIGDLDPSTPKGRARIAYLLKIAKAM